jgi:putative membrane protein
MMSQYSNNRLLALFAGSLIAAASALGATQALAQDTTGGAIVVPGTGGPVTTTRGSLSQESQDFITEAAKGNLGEVVMGTRAQNITENQEIRQYGLKLVEDHSAANQQLKPIAEANAIPWPEQPTEEHQKLEQELSKLSGEEFDKKFMEEMVKDHEKDVEKYEKMAEKVEDEQLKEYVQATLPVLKEHLEMARKIEKSL